MIFASALKAFAPRAQTKSLDWFRENVSTQDGKPYDHGAYPHIGAPGGPCDSLDDPNTLTIWLQWASRVGKTFFGQAASLFWASTNPCPMMFASESEKLSVEVVQRTYKMLERCEPLCEQLRPVNRRRQSQVDLDNCRIYVAWARSVSTLADKPVRLGHANEIDKWEHQTTSKEADPLKLFQDRGKEFPRRKFIFESTPTVKGRSRVERGRLSSTNCFYHVPCPHCGKYQRLRMGDGTLPGGLVWDKLENGKSDKELARRTGRYACEVCAEPIRDEHRTQMMRRGVWAPEGCGVDDAKAAELVASLGARGGDGASATDDPAHEWRGWSHATWITGEPAINGRDSGYQLSSLYALSLGWGDIAAEFVESKEKSQNLRNFINQWLAETWEIIVRKTTWQQLGERVIDTTARRELVPEWASILTVGIDRQSAGGERFPWVVDAWGPGRRNATIAYGEADTFAQLRAGVIEHIFAHADGGAGLKPCFTLMDSGYKPDGVYEFCRDLYKAGLQVWPCKGSNRSLESDYWMNMLGKDSSMPGMRLFHVDTMRTQAWMDRILHVIKAGEAGQFTLYSGSLFEHQDFLEQLLNDAAVTDLDQRNNERESWERIDPGIPNDTRDCKRYAYAAMLVATRGAEVRHRAAPADVKRTAVISSGREKPTRW